MRGRSTSSPPPARPTPTSPPAQGAAAQCERAARAARARRVQTNGRRPAGRPWFAQPGNALLCSVGCIVPRPVEALGGLSIAIGVALAEGLAALPLDAHTRVALKWPNDLLLTATDDGTPRIVGKLAGILIETAWTSADATAVVIGFGINVRGAEAVAAQVDAARAATRERATARRTVDRVRIGQPHRRSPRR